jgi:hypothetical protein
MVCKAFVIEVSKPLAVGVMSAAGRSPQYSRIRSGRLYQGGKLSRSKGIWFSILKNKVTVVNDGKMMFTICGSRFVTVENWMKFFDLYDRIR